MKLASVTFKGNPPSFPKAPRCLLRIFRSFLLLMLVISPSLNAQESKLTVATKQVPPFAMLDANGEWYGLSISLFEAMAEELDIDFQWQEATLSEMITGVESGRFDASIAAITITHERERLVDFSHPFYTTGYGIVVPHSDTSWSGMLGRLFSIDFLKSIGLLFLVLAFVGLCFWLAERGKNREEFRPGLQGIGDGFWFSAVTMTTTGYGDMAPRTWAGRVVGLVWMFTALIITSTFTGMIASSLTAERLEQQVEGPSDLVAITTGSIAGSASDAWLRNHGLDFIPYRSVEDGIEAVANGEIKSFVYDRPLLKYLVEQSFVDTVELVPGTFGRQDYGIALPPRSDFRERLNRAMLVYLASDQWVALQRRWFGPT